MFRLKLIKKPILLKLKTNFSFPPIVLANMQEKETIPTKEKQEIVPDKNYDGLSKVIVDKIPDEYIIPTGNIEITKNGIYNVREKETANVNIPVLKLGTKNITENGVYKASDDELDGYSEVNVETSGVDINDYFDKNIIGGAYNNPGWTQNIKKWRSPLYVTEGTNTAYMFRDFPFDETVLPEVIFLSNEVNLYQMFYNANKLKEIPWLINITAKEYMPNAFAGCASLLTLNKINCEKVTNISGVFEGSSNLTNFGGFENIGKAYLTTMGANDIYYRIKMNYSSNWTEQSLINTLNGLYDIKTKGCKPQQVVLGTTNLAKLTSTEGQQALSQAQQFGWNIS